MCLAASIFQLSAYISQMRNLLVIWCLIPSMVIYAQVIDWSNFNELTMNDVMFTSMNDYTQREYFYPLIRSTVGQGKIYKCIMKNNEKLLLDDLDAKINEKVLWKYDSKIIRSTNQVGSVGLLDYIPCNDVKTYQDIASKCITGWANSVEGSIFMRWSQVGEAVTYYNKKTGTVYLLFAYLN